MLSLKCKLTSSLPQYIPMIPISLPGHSQYYSPYFVHYLQYINTIQIYNVLQFLKYVNDRATFLTVRSYFQSSIRECSAYDGLNISRHEKEKRGIILPSGNPGHSVYYNAHKQFASKERTRGAINSLESSVRCLGRTHVVFQDKNLT